MAARERPKALRTIVPTAAPWLGIDFPMRNNISYPYILQWIALTWGRATQNLVFGDRALWSALFHSWIESGRPFRDLDIAVGLPSELFQEWIAHPELDAYWDAHNPSDEAYARIDIPVLTITGAYDDDQAGALEHYRRHLRASRTGSRNHYLVIGPWDHYRSGTPARNFAGITVGPESLVDLLKLQREWYAWTLEGGPKPEFLRARVAYYVMGSDRWRYAPSLEAVTTRHLTYFLAPGRLQDEPAAGTPDEYCYDPTTTSSPQAAAELRADPESVLDETLIIALADRVMRYQTPPLERETEIAGFFRLRAWISIDTPDTDLYATVSEVLPDGTAIRLASDAIRARYRESLRSPSLIRSTEPLLYDFRRFTFVARTVRVGSSLRLVLAPLGRPVDAAFWQPNFNSGGVISQENRAAGRAVTVRLFHDADRQSVLEVPIGT